jgi:protein TonB
VFDVLIESKRKRDVRSLLGNGAISITIHAIAISLAIYATLHAGEVVQERVRVVDVRMQARQETKKEEPKPEEPPPEQRIATTAPPLKGFQTLAIPTNIPVDIPPPSQNVRFDAADFSGVGAEGGIAAGVEGGRRVENIVTDQPYMEAVVEERPEVVAGTCIQPRYPEILRQAGIEGRVLMEFVIDTLGRAERGSLRVINTQHDLFNGPARDAVLSCRFRPGRIQGRAVRVRVQQPVNFQIQR